MIEYRVECSECEDEVTVISIEEPEFCPMCGRKTVEVTRLEEELQYEEDD